MCCSKRKQGNNINCIVSVYLNHAGLYSEGHRWQDNCRESWRKEGSDEESFEHYTLPFVCLTIRETFSQQSISIFK